MYFYSDMLPVRLRLLLDGGLNRGASSSGSSKICYLNSRQVNLILDCSAYAGNGEGMSHWHAFYGSHAGILEMLLHVARLTC